MERSILSETDLNKNVSAIIVAGGSSTRMGFDKIFAKLGDKSVIEHSICAFLNCDFINDIILVINENTATQLDELIVSMKTDIEIKNCSWRRDEKNSVNNGLKKLDQSCDFVAIHDGARPWINPRQIQRVLQEAKKIGAAASGRPLTDTIKNVTITTLFRKHLS